MIGQASFQTDYWQSYFCCLQQQIMQKMPQSVILQPFVPMPFPPCFQFCWKNAGKRDPLALVANKVRNPYILNISVAFIDKKLSFCPPGGQFSFLFMPDYCWASNSTQFSCLNHLCSSYGSKLTIPQGPWTESQYSRVHWITVQYITRQWGVVTWAPYCLWGA